LINIPEVEYITKCESLLKELIEKDPDNIDFLYYFALLKDKLGKRDEAIKNLKVILA
jgi:hypothetical protein